MKKVRLIYILPLLLGTLSSCSDVWDEKTNNEWEPKYIWTVSEVAQGVLNNAYRAIPNRPDNYGNNFLDAATDNALTSLYSSFWRTDWVTKQNMIRLMLIKMLLIRSA